MRTLIRACATSLLMMGSMSAAAGLLVLDSETQCSAGNSAHGISVKDVTGNNGGASDCWGAFEGNNSNAANPIQIGTSLFSELAKIDVGEAGAPDELSGSDIGLAMTGQGTASGTWSFNAGAVDGDFLVVLKAANKPGFGVWQFAGNPDNTSFSGSWLIAWTVGGGPDPSSPQRSPNQARWPPLGWGSWASHSELAAELGRTQLRFPTSEVQAKSVDVGDINGLFLPSVVGLLKDSVLAAQVPSQDTRFRLLQNPYDLLFRKSLLHRFLLREIQTHHLVQISGGRSRRAIRQTPGQRRWISYRISARGNSLGTRRGISARRSPADGSVSAWRNSTRSSMSRSESGKRGARSLVRSQCLRCNDGTQSASRALASSA